MAKKLIDRKVVVMGKQLSVGRVVWAGRRYLAPKSDPLSNWRAEHESR